MTYDSVMFIYIQPSDEYICVYIMLLFILSLFIHIADQNTLFITLFEMVL